MIPCSMIIYLRKLLITFNLVCLIVFNINGIHKRLGIMRNWYPMLQLTNPVANHSYVTPLHPKESIPLVDGRHKIIRGATCME